MRSAAEYKSMICHDSLAKPPNPTRLWQMLPASPAALFNKSLELTYGAAHSGSEGRPILGSAGSSVFSR